MRDLNLPYLALQNLWRKPYRAAVIALCIAVATGTLFAATLVMRGVQNSLQVGLARLGADLIVVPQGHDVVAQEAFITGQPTTFYMDQRVADQVAAVPGVARTSSQVFIQTLTNARCCIGEFFLVGFDPRTDFTLAPWLATHLADKPLGPYDLIVGDRILLGPTNGVTFYGTSFTVAGVLEPTGMGMDRTVFVPIEGMRNMITASSERAVQTIEVGPDQISSVLVKLAPGADPIDVAEAIEARVDGVKAITASQLNQAVGRQLQGVLSVTLAVTGTLWLMSLLTIGLVFSLIVNERQRELGLLRAMGARKDFVFRLVLGEAGLLTGLGGIGGLLASEILLISFGNLLQHRLRIPYLWPSPVETLGLVALMLLLALAAGALASLQPAWRSSRLEPYQAIRQGE